MRGTLVFVIAVVLWVVAGFLVTAPLGAIYGWSGHPSIPAAPMSVYVIVYLFVLPVACIAAAWKTALWVESRLDP